MPEVYWRLFCTASSASCHFHSEVGRWNFNELWEVTWNPWKWIFFYSSSITNNSSVCQLNVAKTVNIVLSIYNLDFLFIYLFFLTQTGLQARGSVESTAI